MNTEINLELQKLLIKKGIDVRVQATIADVVMWIYKKHDIWIVVDYYNDGDSDIWFYNLKLSTKESMEEGYNSPTEAYEAAINYTLKNLIK